MTHDEQAIMPLINRVATSCHPYNTTEHDEFVSVGMVGYAYALRSWDPVKSSFLTWATTNVRWYILNYIREQSERLRMASLDAMAENVGDSIADEQSSCRDSESPSDTYLSGLPHKTRNIIQMLYWDGLRQGEVAERTGMTRQSVINHKTKGLRIMRERLNRMEDCCL